MKDFQIAEKKHFHSFTVDRVGQLVIATHHPGKLICMVTASNGKRLNHHDDTLHAIKFPQVAHWEHVYESQWPSPMYEELDAVDLQHYQKTVARDSDVINALMKVLLDVRNMLEADAPELTMPSFSDRHQSADIKAFVDEAMRNDGVITEVVGLIDELPKDDYTELAEDENG